jgi:hypothetical protein
MLQFMYGPGPLWLNVLAAIIALPLIVVTALKGRWLWLVPALLFDCIILLIPIFLRAKPGSRWARRKQRRRPSARTS